MAGRRWCHHGQRRFWAGYSTIPYGYEEVALFTRFLCCHLCDAGLLFRVEETRAGIKGIFVSLQEGELLPYRVTLDVQGRITSREVATMPEAPGPLRVELDACHRGRRFPRWQAFWEINFRLRPTAVYFRGSFDAGGHREQVKSGTSNSIMKRLQSISSSISMPPLLHDHNRSC